MESNKIADILILISGMVLIAYIFTLSKHYKSVDYKVGKDSVYIHSHVDTIKADTIVIHKPVIKWRTVTIYVDSSNHDTLHIYKETYTDSLIDAFITTRVKGLLDSTLFTYKAKFPLRITKRDSIFLSRIDTLILNNPKFAQHQLILGAQVNLGSSLGLMPQIGWADLKGNQMYVGYDLINKYYGVSYQKTIGLKW